MYRAQRLQCVYIHKLSSFLHSLVSLRLDVARCPPQRYWNTPNLSSRWPSLSPDWYSVPIVGKCWNACSLILTYYHAIIAALLDMFPEIVILSSTYEYYNVYADGVV